MKKKMKFIPVIILLQVLYFLIAYIITAAFEEGGNIGSAADSIIMSLGKENIYTYVTAVIALIVFEIIGESRKYNIILRSGGGSRIFLNMALKAGISSACLAVFHVFSTAIWSKLMGREWINWSAGNSVYCYICAGRTTDISFVRVALSEVMGAFIVFYIIALIMIISGWMYGRVMAVAVVVLIFFADKYLGSYIIFKLLIPGYENIADGYAIVKSIIAGTAIIAGLYAAGRMIIKRKDYIN